MKNIIKRGTSLLLVVAMLLSFAAAVGAEPATTEGGVSGQFVKIWAEPVALKAGERAKVPVYVEVDSSYGLGLVNFNVYSDPGITIANIQQADGVSGNLVSGDYVTASGRTEKIAVWTSNVPLGWTKDEWDDTLQKPTTNKHLLAYLMVMADNDVTAGGYEIHFAPFQNGKDNGKTDVVVEVIAADNEADKGAYKKDSTEIIDGAAIVYDTLPMVALTKTTFDVPTMEDWLDFSPNNMAGKYDLSEYLKIVDTDTDGTVKLFDVEMFSASNATGLKGVQFDTVKKQLIVNPRKVTDVTGNGTLTIDSATAGTHTVSNETVTFKIAKDEPTLWKASFADYQNSYRNTIDFYQGNKTCFTLDDNNTYYAEAPDYNGNVPARTASMNPTVFDRYGQTLSGYTATATVALFSDSKYQNDVTSTYADYVKVNGTNLEISKELPTDVYCRLTVGVNGSAAPETQTVAEFLIKSTKPHATSAEIVLKDVKGNQYTDSQGKPLYIFTIPAPGQNPVQITIDATVYDQKNGVMDGVTYTVKAYWGTKDTPGTDIPETGVEASATLSDANVLEITSKALENLGSATEVKLTVEIAVDGISDKITQEIKLVKAQPVATYLAAGADGTASNLVRGNIFLNHNVVYLPGINETKESLSAAYPVYVMDQYGQHVENDGKNATVPAANFKLYPATLAGESDEDTVVYENVSYKKNGNEIDGKYAKFEDNSNGGVKLTITNGWDKDNNRLAVPDGHYIIEATYPNPSNAEQPLVARCVIKLTKAPVPTTATVTASAETIYVPYASEYGALEEGKASEVTLTAKVEDQYGDSVSGAITMELDNPIYGVQCIALDGTNLTRDHAAFTGVTESNTVTVGLTNKAVQELKSELSTHSMTVKVKVKVGGTAVGDTQTVSVNVSREASVLKKATVVMKQGETEVASEALTAAEYQKDVNLISPKVDTNYYFAVKYFDQYGGEMTSTFGTAFYPETTELSWQGGTTNMLTAKAGAEGTFSLTIPGGNTRFQFNVKFAPMQFVNGKGKPYTIDKLLYTAKLSKVYNRDTWYQVIEGASAVTGPNDENSKVYIRGAEGQNNVEVTQKIWAEVIDKTTGQTVYDARDSLANPAGPTASTTEKAGTYIVKIFYREKEGDAPIEVCSSGEFTISPKPITIGLKANATIEKEYDGTTKLPGDAADKLELTGKVGNDDVDIETGNLVFESKDVNASVDSETNLVIGDVNIVAVTGASSLSGDDAGNYTASIAGLKGKITQKALDVYVEYYNKEWNGTKIIGGDAGRLADQSQVAKDDVVSVSSTRTTGLEFASSDAGSKLPATLPEGASITVTLEGASAGNYKVGTISYNGGDTGATITKATFTLNASDLNKTYTYGETVNLNVAANLLKKSTGQSIDETTVNAIGNTAITLTLDKNSNSNGRYNVGTYTATVSVPTNQQNYTVDLKGTPTIKINPRGITIALKSGVEISKTYDGTNNKPSNITDASFDVTVAGGEVSGETVKLNVGELKYADANASENPIDISVGSNFWSIEGGDKSNYRFEGLNSLTGTITPKAITASMFSQKEPHPVYDGTERTLTGSVLDGKDSGIQVNGENKVLQLGTDFTAAEVKGTNADEYTMTVTGQGNYTGYVDVKVEIDPYNGNVFTKWDDYFRNVPVEVTRGEQMTYELPTNVVLNNSDLVYVQNSSTQKAGKLAYHFSENWTNITNGSLTATNGKKLVFSALVTDQAAVGQKFALTIEEYVENANVTKATAPGGTATIIFEVTDKPEQESFQIVEGSEGTYSYSQGGVQLTTSGSATGSTVTWSSSDENFATVDSNGKVTFVKPTTTADVIITATASETSAPNALFKATERTYRLTITKGQVTITASSATMTANDPLPGFSATASGLNPKDSVSKVFQTLTASVSTDGKTAGTFRVTPNAVFKTGVKDWNEYYELSFVQGTLTVNPAVSVIDTVLPTIIAGNGCANGYANCACESFYDLDASRWYHEAIDWAYNLGLMNGTTKSTFGPNAAATRAQTWTMLARIAGQDTRRSSTWYEVGQKWAMNLGITDGTNPMGSLTREQLAAMLYRYVGSPAVNGTLTFTDSANVSTWARNAMIWAVQNGILDGVGGNRLNPKGTTTRAQAAAIFMRFSKLINK